MSIAFRGVRILHFTVFAFKQFVLIALPILLGLFIVFIQLFFRAVVKSEHSSTDFWQLAALIALSVSVFSAFVLYYQFPASYRILNLHPATDAILHFVIPTVQVLSIAYASVKLHNARLHAIATTIYLALFVLWDWIILCATRTTTDDAARAFRSTVWDYFHVDLPCAATFAFLFWMASNQPEPDFGVFVAGMLAFQASTAFYAALRFYHRGLLCPVFSRTVEHFNTTFECQVGHRSATWILLIGILLLSLFLYIV